MQCILLPACEAPHLYNLAHRRLDSTPLDTPKTLAIIAGNGVYPQAMARAARAAGVARLAVAAFQNETDPALTPLVDEMEWMRVGQLGKLLDFLQKSGASHAVMSGQIHPRNLFDLRPDLKALVVLARLKRRNAESIFGAIADEMKGIGVELLPATTYMEEHLAPAGLIAGPKLKPRGEDDLRYGFHIAKECSRLDIGQTVVVKNGTVLAVEAFEGTNAAIQRGGELGAKDAVDGQGFQAQPGFPLRRPRHRPPDPRSRPRRAAPRHRRRSRQDPAARTREAHRPGPGTPHHRFWPKTNDEFGEAGQPKVGAPCGCEVVGDENNNGHFARHSRKLSRTVWGALQRDFERV